MGCISLNCLLCYPNAHLENIWLAELMLQINEGYRGLENEINIFVEAKKLSKSIIGK